MTSADQTNNPADRKDLVTTQEKLEWVTPQISLMGSVDITNGKIDDSIPREVTYQNNLLTGPS